MLRATGADDYSLSGTVADLREPSSPFIANEATGPLPILVLKLPLLQEAEEELLIYQRVFLPFGRQPSGLLITHPCVLTTGH